MPTWFAVVASGLSLVVALPFAELGICAASIVVAALWVWWLVARPPSQMLVEPKAATENMQAAVIDRGNSMKPSDGPSTAQQADTSFPRLGVDGAAWPGTPPGKTNSWRPQTNQFERNRGVAGHLYAARNDQHRDDLFKLGQTAGSVADRLLRLNQEHSSSAHVGEFRSVHSVQVTDALGDEERLFQLLSDYRVHAGTEFFMVPIEYLVTVMAAVSASSSGAMNDAVAVLPPPPAVPSVLQALVRDYSDYILAPFPPRPAGGGFVVVLRNKWHKPDLFRIASTERDLIDYLDVENATQRRHTSQVGFYAVVEAFTTARPQSVCASVLRRSKARRIGRSSFVVMPLAALSAAIRNEIERGEQPPDIILSAPPPHPHLEATPQPESGRRPIRQPLALPQVRNSPLKAASPEPALPPRQRPEPGQTWRTNTCPHPRCLAPVRAAGPVGYVGKLRCSTCRRIVEFEIRESATLDVWHD